MVFQKRIIFIVFCQTILFCLLITRLIFLQVVYRNYYKKLSDQNRVQLRVILPKRGIIYDRNKEVIAHQEPSYKGYVRANSLKDLQAHIKKLSGFIEDINPMPKTFLRRYPFAFKDHLSWEEMARIESHNFDAVFCQKSPKRAYPHEDLFCHALGYVSPVTEKEREDFNPNLFIGHGGGIETVYENMLQGKLGYVEEEVDASGRFIRTLAIRKPEIGDPLHTNLDLKLQEHIYACIKKNEDIKSASVIVLDPYNGDVHALLSYPGYNANLLSRYIPAEIWKQWIYDPLRPLYNKAIQGQYAPGSVLKMLFALYALKHKLVTKDTRFFCPGHLDVRGKKFHCWKWKHGGHGSVNMYEALIHSCDVYFYQLGLRAKIKDFIAFAKDFGLCEKSGIDLLHEKKGLIASNADLVNLSIGQGKILMTPLQMAVMMAALVNGGKIITPRVVSSSATAAEDPAPSNLDPLPAQKMTDDLTYIKKCMDDVVNFGTGHKAYADMGGKTGTTQVKSIALNERKTGIIRTFFYKDHAFFAGYTPQENPKFVVVVLIEHGGWGSSAAMLAREIVSYWQKVQYQDPGVVSPPERSEGS